MAGSVDLGSVYATLDLKTNNFESGISSASSAMGGLQQTILGVFGGNLLFSAVNKATDLLIGFGKTAIQSSADFQTSMNVLQVVTGATATEMESLRKKAIDLGNDITLPAVSASDAADAMTELGKAGLSVKDVLAASKGVLQAAAAGNIDVATSAQLVSGALLAFNLAGTESARVADLMAAAANASNLELGQVGIGLTQAGAQAKLAGVPIEQTVGLLAQMANKGISAEQAGTSLSYMLRQLTAPTQKAKEVMSDLGLSVFDSNGKFVGMRETIIRLNKATAGMSQEQKAAALNVIFGAEAMKGAASIMADGVEGFDKMQVAVTKQGAAAKLAGARTKGLNGIIQAIQSQFETFALTIGDKVRPLLEKIGQFVSDHFIPIMGALGAVIGTVLVVGLYAATTAMIAFIAASTPITGPILLIEAGVGLLVGIIVELQQKFQIVSKAMKALQPVIQLIKDTWNELYGEIKRLAGLIGDELAPVFEFVSKHADTFKKIGLILLGVVLLPIASIVIQIIAGMKLLAAVLDFVSDHFDGVKQVIGVILKVAFAPLYAAIKLVKDIMGELGITWSDIWNSIKKIAKEASDKVVSYINNIKDAWTDVVKGVQKAKDDIEGFINSIVRSYQNFRNGVSDAVDTAKNKFDTFTERLNNAKNLISNAFDGGKGTTAFVNQIDTINDKLAGSINNILKPYKDAWENAKNSAKNTFDTASTSIQNFADQLPQKLKSIGDSIVNTWDSAYQSVKNFFSNAWQSVDDFVNNLPQRLESIGKSISDAWNNAYQKTVEFFKNLPELLKPDVKKSGEDITEHHTNAIKDKMTSIETIRKVGDAIATMIALAIILVVVYIVDAAIRLGKSLIEGLNNGIKSLAGATWNAIKYVADQIGNFFSGAINWLYDTGRAIFQGLINGMKSIAGGVYNTAKDIMSKVRNLLPFSPAKEGPFSGKGWTLYSGRALMQGFAQGIESQKSALAASLAGSLNGVSGLLNSNMSVSASAVQPGVTGGLTVYGDVNIANKSDADYLLAKLSRRQDLTTDGLVGA